MRQRLVITRHQRGPLFPARSFDDAAQLLPALSLPARGRLPDALLQPGLPASSGSVTDHGHGLRLIMRADEDGTSACIRVPPGILTFGVSPAVINWPKVRRSEARFQSGLVAKVERVRYAKAPHPSSRRACRALMDDRVDQFVRRPRIMRASGERGGDRLSALRTPIQFLPGHQRRESIRPHRCTF